MSVPALTGTDISNLLQSKGPIVKAVLLRSGPEATIEQVEIDTTPQKQMVCKILGGPITFLGQYEEEGIMIICLRDGDKNDKVAVNEHKLQPPFDASQVRGDILLLRVAAEESTEEGTDGPVDTLASKSNDEFFLDYTKDEYTRFAARTDIQPPKSCSIDSQQEEEAEDMNSDEDDDDDEVEDDDDDDGMEGESDEEDDDVVGFMELLMGQVLDRFQQEHGRMPDEVEMEALQSAIAQKVA
jgi:hypothetical protein